MLGTGRCGRSRSGDLRVWRVDKLHGEGGRRGGKVNKGVRKSAKKRERLQQVREVAGREGEIGKLSS